MLYYLKSQFTSFKKWFLRPLLKVEYVYTGPLDTELVDSMNDCDPEVCILMVKGVGTSSSLLKVRCSDLTGAFTSQMPQTVSWVFFRRSFPTSFSKINDDIVTAWYAMIFNMNEFDRCLHCRRDCGFFYRPARSTTSRGCATGVPTICSFKLSCSRCYLIRDHWCSTLQSSIHRKMPQLSMFLVGSWVEQVRTWLCCGNDALYLVLWWN